MERRFRFTCILTEQCNLRCKYCYVTCHKHISDEIMSEEVIDKIIEMGEEKINDPNYGLVSFDLFGGEPLVCWDRLKYFLEKAKELDNKYPGKLWVLIFSNATLLDREKAEYIRSLGVANFNFSLDGCKEAHDSCRVYADGRGSYDDTMRGIEIYREVFGIGKYGIGAKSVISPDNCKYMVQTAKEFLDAGIKRISFSLDRDDVWDENSLATYKQELRKLADFYIENINEGIWYDIFSIPIIDAPMNKRNQGFCSCGREHYGITPNGDIYPCQRFYNNRSKFKLGNVFDGIDNTNPWVCVFKNFASKSMIGCNKCDTFKNNGCMGQCVAACYESSGNIFKCIPSICEIHKYTYKVALEIDEVLKDNEMYKRTLDFNAYGG